ncbi:MAG: GNAT family N-acetyltransferase [Ignavibacteria bacterium]|nr:GNAT family N-acetyltransferase [Ignavibacteria bacterium]
MESDRLKLLALTIEEVELYRHADNRLEDSLGFKQSGRTITEQYSNALEKYTINWMKADPENQLFAAVWIIIEKASNSIAGELGFKRKPDKIGNIEIGYSIQPDFRNKGFITEAIKLLSDWAFTHKDVKAIIAETLDDNIPSIKALAKNGFSRYAYSKPLDADAAENTETVKMIWHILRNPNI